MRIWKVAIATLIPPEPLYESPQLDQVLNDLEREGWIIFSVVAESMNPRARVIAYREAKGA